ncbi:hypothetical protein [Sphingopyxis sp.]|uniref:hypothetical protein n=1 Tax=Sphingopyxis sp. TaxID=1908224 RepID=UPI0025D58E6E|nr:hypothetical protein [Sphingopyxis sp.]MBK6414373.1 hypothetical protein [Sphingopyxis sp.]
MPDSDALDQDGTFGHGNLVIFRRFAVGSIAIDADSMARSFEIFSLDNVWKADDLGADHGIFKSYDDG